MKGLINFVLASQLLLTIGIQAQTTSLSDSGVGGSSPTASAPVNPVPQSTAIRILTPAAGQTFANTNVVDVRFEIVNPVSSAGTPTFVVQLDGNDPVRTSSMQQTFTGLAPGAHNITVEMVDANNTPVSGSRSTVQFTVAPVANTTAPSQPSNPGGTASSRDSAPRSTQATQGGPQDPSLATAGQEPLPSANSLLPLISVIGFGVLVGGIASAMKTR